MFLAAGWATSISRKIAFPSFVSLGSITTAGNTGMRKKYGTKNLREVVGEIKERSTIKRELTKYHPLDQESSLTSPSGLDTS